MKRFGRRLRQLRQQKGLTQADLAHLAKIHPMQVGKYERGEGYPAVEALVALSRALRVSIDFLLTGNNEPPEDDVAFQFPLLQEKVRELDQEIEKGDLAAILPFLDAYIAKKRMAKIMTA